MWGLAKFGPCPLGETSHFRLGSSIYFGEACVSSLERVKAYLWPTVSRGCSQGDR